MRKRKLERRSFAWVAAVIAVPLAFSVTGAGGVGDRLSGPPGLPAVPVPARNPLTPEKVALGERLFFEPGLSADGSVSCASCHRPDHFFSDQPARSAGTLGLEGARNAGSVLNAAYSPFLLSDGRATSLEDQVQYPVANPLEMNNTQESVVSYLGGQPSYAPLFVRAFGDALVTWERVTDALASFERTLVSGNSPFDRFIAGDVAAISPAARRGWDLFRGEAGCISCHTFNSVRPFFSDFEFHNTGVAWFPETQPPSSERLKPDLGHYWVSRDRRHIGAFRTIGLRNVAQTAPYMHGGKLETLQEVIDFYSAGPRQNPFLDPRMVPLELTTEQKADLIEFLESLTGEVSYGRSAGGDRVGQEATPGKERR